MQAIRLNKSTSLGIDKVLENLSSGALTTKGQHVAEEYQSYGARFYSSERVGNKRKSVYIFENDQEKFFLNFTHFSINIPHLTILAGLLVTKENPPQASFSFSRRKNQNLKNQSYCFQCHVGGGFIPLDADGKKYSLSSNMASLNLEEFNHMHLSSNIRHVFSEFYENLFLEGASEYGEPEFLDASMSSQKVQTFWNYCTKTKSKKLRLSSKELEQVVGAFNCTSCHGSEELPVLTPYLSVASDRSFKDFQKIIRYHVSNDYMPPRKKLNFEQKEVLLNCMNLKFFGQIDDPHSPYTGDLLESLFDESCLVEDLSVKNF